MQVRFLWRQQPTAGQVGAIFACRFFQISAKKLFSKCLDFSSVNWLYFFHYSRNLFSYMYIARLVARFTMKKKSTKTLKTKIVTTKHWRIQKVQNQNPMTRHFRNTSQIAPIFRCYNNIEKLVLSDWYFWNASSWDFGFGLFE